MNPGVLPYTIDALFHAIAAWKEEKNEVGFICSALLIRAFEECDQTAKTFMQKYIHAFIQNIIEQLYWIKTFDKDSAEKILENLGYTDLNEKLHEICAKYKEVPPQQIIRNVAENLPMNTFFKWLLVYSTAITILESKDPEKIQKLDWIDKYDTQPLMQSFLGIEFKSTPVDTIIAMKIEERLKGIPEDQHCLAIEKLKDEIPDRIVIRFEGNILNDLIRETGYVPPLFKVEMLEQSDLVKTDAGNVHPRDILARTYEILVMCEYIALKNLSTKFNA